MDSPKLKLGSARPTPQRAAILGIIESAQGPLSAAQIYEIARQNRPDLGLATIYRTLKILQQEQTVRFVSLPDGVARFEKAGLGQHHFQCRRCARIWTIGGGAVKNLGGSRLENGFVIEDHNSTFYGLCARCAVES